MTFDRTLLPGWIDYASDHDLPLTGRGKWRTTECRLHGGSDSLRVNTQTGGWCCMACGMKGGDTLSYHMVEHGLQFMPAAKSLGAWIDDGQPVKHHRPTALSARDALSVLAFETMLCAVAAGNVGRGVILSATDLSRVMTAAGRINQIAKDFQ